MELGGQCVFWRPGRNDHRGVSNSFPGFSPSNSSLEGGFWFSFPESEVIMGGAELWLLSSLIFPFMASCTNSKISRGSLLNLSWYSCSSSTCSWETARERVILCHLGFYECPWRSSLRDGQRLGRNQLMSMSSTGFLLWKILKEMGIPDHLTCLLRNLYAGQEATVRTGHGKKVRFNIRKGVCHSFVLSPCLSNFYAESSMWNAGLDEFQTSWNQDFQGEISTTSDMQMTPLKWQKVKRN